MAQSYKAQGRPPVSIWLLFTSSSANGSAACEYSANHARSYTPFRVYAAVLWSSFKEEGYFLFPLVILMYFSVTSIIIMDNEHSADASWPSGERKRVRKQENWVNNVQKRKRNSGQSSLSLSLSLLRSEEFIFVSRLGLWLDANNFLTIIITIRPHVKPT